MNDKELLTWLKLRMKGADHWGDAPTTFDELREQFSTDFPDQDGSRGALKVALTHALEIARGLSE